MIEIIITLIVLILGFFTITQTPSITPTPTPKSKPRKRVRFKEPIMSHAMTNHATSELMRRQAELSRNNSPGNEFISTAQYNWPPSVNS